MTFLSVIIAAHNAEKTLAATLESLNTALGDTRDAVEVILFNDSSDDATQTIIDQWVPRLPNALTRCVNYRNVGQVRSSAVALASGEYITMLDSDDLLKPLSLHDAVAFLRKQQPDMLLTRLLEIRDLRKISTDWQGFTPEALTQDDAIRRFLIHKDFQAHLIGQFIRRDIYQRNPIPVMVCYEDFAVFPGMLMQASQIFYQRAGHYYYVKRPDSLSTTLDASKITPLVECTLSMEKQFPAKFKPLINCHWFDIYSNHRAHLTPQQMQTVKKRVDELYSLGFFFAGDVRFSYKKRAIKAWLKK
ncbi:glycosyltransferase family 2 protein [Kosakonia sp.]|uniref:glycosyltransferase family 2 protein n=1 Tax=Kosakonia sp. TaxID=1916651 RepID=UPI0028966D83|nr:glycosyltransferase family 2 protein [Kosakonia sp.]